MKCLTRKSASRLILSGIFQFWYMYFAKCSAAHHLLNQCAETDVRANRRFLKFAVNARFRLRTERTWNWNGLFAYFRHNSRLSHICKSPDGLQSITNHPDFYSRHSFSQPHDKKYFIFLELSDDDAFWSKSVRQTRQSMQLKQSALFFQDTWQRTRKPRMPKPDNQTTDKTAS